MAYTGLVDRTDFVRQTRNSKVIGKMQHYPHVFGQDTSGVFKPIPVNDDSKLVANTEYVQDNVEVINQTIASVDNSVVHLQREETIVGYKHFDANVEIGTNHQFLINSPTTSTQEITAPQFNGNLNGISLKAKWADLAEFYEMDNKYPIGTLVGFGGEKELTIAGGKCVDIFKYVNANFVVSDKPALVMNSAFEEDENFQPVALMGRVLVRVIGEVKKHTRLHLHGSIPGVASPSMNPALPDGVIIVALEDNTSPYEKLVECFVKAGV